MYTATVRCAISCPGSLKWARDGIHPLEPVGATGDCDLNTVKQRYGRRICLVGNIQYEDFAEMTPPQMKSRVKQLMDAAKAGGGFILSPACPLFHSRMPEKIEANIRAYVDAGLEYGRY